MFKFKPMEPNNPAPTPPTAQDLVLMEILENTRKTKKYMQWQFYITIALIVLPLFGMIIAIPIILKGLTAYTSVLQ